MTRRRLNAVRITAATVALVAAAAAFIAWIVVPRPARVDFAGCEVQIPHGWRVQARQPSTGIISFTPHGSQEEVPATLDLLDERSHPEDSAKLLQHWESSAGATYFGRLSAARYRDTAVDQGHLLCVAVRYNAPIPLQIYCITENGHWRVVLFGHDSDISGLDQLARQVATLESKR